MRVRHTRHQHRRRYGVDARPVECAAAAARRGPTEVLDFTGRWRRERAAAQPASATARTCGRTGAGAPATTRRACWSSGPPGSASATARCGACTSAGAATTCTSPNGSARACAAARRRRAARARRDPPGAGRDATPPRGPTSPGRTPASTGSPTAARATCAPAEPPAHAAPGGAQHLGGRLLRPRPRPARRARRPGRRGRGGAVRAGRRLVPGRRDDTAGLGDWYVDPQVWPRRACARWPTTCASSACSSGCGSSRRWSTPTPTSPASTPTGSWPRRGRPPAPPATSTCSTWPHPDAYAYLLERLDTLVGRVPASTTSSGTTTATCSRRCTAGERRRARADRGRLPAARRAARAAPRPGDRVVLLRRRPHRLGILERTDRVWTSDTTTRWSARPSSAGPACCCRPS